MEKCLKKLKAHQLRNLSKNLKFVFDEIYSKNICLIFGKKIILVFFPILQFAEPQQPTAVPYPILFLQSSILPPKKIKKNLDLYKKKKGLLFFILSKSQSLCYLELNSKSFGNSHFT